VCGIWGIFNKDQTVYTKPADKEMAEHMSIVSTSRGRHSAGFCFTPKLTRSFMNQPEPPQPKIIRSVGSPFSIIHNVAGAKALEDFNHLATGIFGHNRHATKGSIKTSNAHPFSEGDWVLVHNGTLWSGVDMSKQDVEVDSHALCHKIESVGIREALTTIDGAFAVIAYNKKEGKVYFARNGQRPLHYFEHDKYSYVMSEALDLEYCLRKFDRYRCWKERGESGLVTSFKEHVLYQLTEEGIKDIDSITPKTKSFFPVGPQGAAGEETPRTSFTKNTSSLPLIGHVVQKAMSFQVAFINEDAKSNCYIYTAYNDDEEEVSFITKEKKPELIGQWGSACIIRKATDHLLNKTTYRVRYKEIVWEGAFKKVINNPVYACQDCAAPIEDLSTALQLHSDDYVCGACVESFKKYGWTNGPGPKMENLQ